MASLTQWTWAWVDSVGWWWTGKPGVLRFMGLQRMDMTEQLNWMCEPYRKLWTLNYIWWFSRVRHLAIWWTISVQAPWGFFTWEYWSGLPWSPPGDLPNPGIEPRSSTLQVYSLPSEPPGKPKLWTSSSIQWLSHVRVFATHESQHTRPSCPSQTPEVRTNSCPSSQWCHPAISSSVVPFSSCPQSLPASESFPMSQLFTWGGQSTGVSALASFLPKKSQGWSPSEWTGWISLQSKESQEPSPTRQFKSINSSVLSLLHSPTLTSICDYRKNHSLD